MINIEHYVSMLKYHEDNKTSTNDRNNYWKKFDVSVKNRTGF